MKFLFGFARMRAPDRELLPLAESMTAPHSQSKSLSRVLFGVFLLTMIMGTGPGTLLVNRAIMVRGIPLLYLWGILWYVVLVSIALIAFFRLWKDDAVGDQAGDDS